MEQPTARVTFDRVLHELRTHNFAVLSTVGAEGSPHSAGINYGVSGPDRQFAIYVMTRRHLLKARNVAENSRVSMVVPLNRRLLRFLPPATIQLRGAAQILDSTDSEGIEVFRRFWMGRRILAAYAASARHAETRVCFIKIIPDPVIHTYMVGYGVLALRKRMESEAARVLVQPPRDVSDGSLSSVPGAPDQ